MGGLAVLRPQDCIRRGPLPRHESLISSQMKPHRNPNPNPNSTRSNRRKRSPEKKNENNNKNKSRHAMAVDFPAKNLVMGQVKILKRGEEMMAPKNRVDEKKYVESDGVLLSSAAEKPVTLPKQMRIGDFYAGSAIFSSPPPSSLPLPAFFAKKTGSVTDVDDVDASTYLRQLLGLDLL